MNGESASQVSPGNEVGFHFVTSYKKFVSLIFLGVSRILNTCEIAVVLSNRYISLGLSSSQLKRKPEHGAGVGRTHEASVCTDSVNLLNKLPIR